jgi:hypothetical protein
MAYPIDAITVTDEYGIDYTDLFADIDFDEADLIGSTGITAIDVTLPHLPVSPRSNVDGPLGALIERWVAAHTEHTGNIYGWQYLDANDIHTIAWEEDGEVRFVTIFGYSADGHRAYRLRSIAKALGLSITFSLV